MNSHHPITTWHICISGFLQREGRPNGIVALWNDLHFLHSGENTRVELRSWSEDWSNIAEFIWRLRSEGESPKINIYGYSWGGFSAMVFAKQLAKRSLAVENIVLSDAVYRHDYIFGQWRAFVPWMKIKIPANVRHVSWFRQWSNLPRGHSAVAEDPSKTNVKAPFEVRSGVTHQYMDDYPPFHAEANRRAAMI